MCPVCVATISPVIVAPRGDVEDRDVHGTRIGRVAGGLAAEEIDRRLVVIGLEKRAQTTTIVSSVTVPIIGWWS